MEYAENFLDYRNSVEKQTKTEEMRRINAVYNYHLREKENNRLKTENKKMWYWLIGAAIVILILVGIIYIVILYAKNRRMKHRIAVEKLHRMEKDYHERSEEFIAENTEKILRLEKQLRDISNYNNELKVKIEEQKETLEAANKLARMDIRRHAEALERISESTIYGKIQLVLRDDNKMLRKEDWKELENEVLNEFPNFRDALMSLTYEIKEQEYKISMLIKLGFAPSSIATLICKTKETVSSARRRLYSKVFNREGSPDDWDKFIRTL